MPLHQDVRPTGRRRAARRHRSRVPELISPQHASQSRAAQTARAASCPSYGQDAIARAVEDGEGPARTPGLLSVAAYLTDILARSSNERGRIAAAATIGLLLGVAVSFRLPNLFLSAGYFVVLLAITLRTRDLTHLVAFGLAYGLGLVPTLLANAVNAGGILKTTYGSVDAAPPDFSFSIALDYLADLQGPLIVLTMIWATVSFGLP